LALGQDLLALATDHIPNLRCANVASSLFVASPALLGHNNV